MADDQLHIPSLMIEGFQGIGALHLEDLGRVTLLAGANGSGKTTTLDAAAVYASRGAARGLADVVVRREAWIGGLDDDGTVVSLPDFSVLFHQRGGARRASKFEIRSCASDPNALSIAPGNRADERYFTDGLAMTLAVGVGDAWHEVQPFPIATARRSGWHASHRSLAHEEVAGAPAPIPSRMVGPAPPASDELGTLWDSVALTDAEELALDAARLVLGNAIERFAVIGDHAGPGKLPGGRRPFAKLRGIGRPVPLRLLGDGATRLFALALTLANCRDGLLLIDEAENGIHHAIQADMWRLVFAAAWATNVQVIATTHSWDCAAGFARAAADGQGVLFRLDQQADRLDAVRYSGRDLAIAADQRIEVR